MTYLVLARKYRPERFADMVGQEHITRVLGQAIEQSRTHHAYLFCGVRGLGKTSAARILARCMVCEHGPTAEPCNQCEQCLAVTESRSVDVREIDGASHNSVDDIRSLREQVHYLPQSARKKIYIIDEVHMLTTSAFNALLKTLEEPPPHVLFIFATTDPHKVLPTILSRVSRLDFRRVPTEPLAQHLSNILDKEGAKAEQEALRIIAQAGEGSVRDALTQMDKVLAFCRDRNAITAQEVRAILGRADPNALSDIVDEILRRNVQAILEKLDDVMAQGGDARSVVLGLLGEFRNLAVLRLTTDADALVDENPARLSELKQRASNCDPQHLSQLFDRLMRSAEKLDRAPNPRLALEMALIELAIAPPLSDISTAIAKLSGGGNPGGQPPNSPSTGPSRNSAPGDGKAPAPRHSSPQSNPQRTAPTSKFAALAQNIQKNTSAPSPSRSTPQAAANSPSSPEVSRAGARSALAKELWRVVQGSNQKTPTSPAPPTEVPNTESPSPTAPAVSTLSALEQNAAPDPQLPEKTPTLERWIRMLDRLRDANESMMLAMLSDIGVRELSVERIVLCASPSNFSRQKLQSVGPNRDRFLAWLAQEGLDPEKLRWEDQSPSIPEAPSWSLYTAKAREHHRHLVSQRARAHSGVLAIIDALDADITSLRVLRDHNGQGMDSPFGR